MLERQIVTVKSITKYWTPRHVLKGRSPLNWQDRKISQLCQQINSVENNCHILDLVQAFPTKIVGLRSEMRTFLPVWGGVGPGGVAHHVLCSNAAAFFFRIVASSLYAMLQELKFDESLLCFKNYKFPCFVELLRTDWRGCPEVCILYALGSMARCFHDQTRI